MLKDTSYNHSTSGSADITAPANHAVSVMLEFIDNRISGFRNYYLSANKSDKENFITNQLVNYFNSWLIDDTAGYIPYKFSFQKNPAQEQSTKETDVGIFILNPSIPSNTIFEFEAKRLSDSSNNNEYVYGDRGGIERFKRNFHAHHLERSGMFGYIQSYNAAYWITKINEWITKCAGSQFGEIDWSLPEEKLIKNSLNIDRCISYNLRNNNHPIHLFHYFIDLTL